MQYTADQIAAFKTSFETRRQLQTIVGGALVIAFLLGVVFQARLGIRDRWLFLLWLLFIVGSGAFRLITWRCPACKRYLGRWRVQFCPRCGLELR